MHYAKYLLVVLQKQSSDLLLVNSTFHSCYNYPYFKYHTMFVANLSECIVENGILLGRKSRRVMRLHIINENSLVSDKFSA